MITVAIIGLLAAIAIPSFLYIRGRVHENIVAQDFRVIYDAMKRFHFDEGRYPKSFGELKGYIKNIEGLAEKYEINPDINEGR